MKSLAVLLLSLLFISTGFSKIINVPADIDSIQGGIDLSVDGDTVLVQPGTYMENINFNGKAIVVAGLFLTTKDTSYISQTVIDGNNNGSVVIFQNGENSASFLCGFFITNGKESFSDLAHYEMGGGVHCDSSRPRLENLIIKGNSNFYGGGIYLIVSSPSITNVTICNNRTVEYGYNGGGICCQDHSNPCLTNVTICNNSAEMNGGGIYCENHSSAFLANVTIKNNSAANGGGIWFEPNSSPIFDDLHRCNIYLNIASMGNDIYCDIFNNASTTTAVIVDTFTVKNPTDFHAFPISQFRFDIQHGKTEQTNADLYVSPEGDSSNSGLSASAPLKTIYHAFSKIAADSLNPRTIHLANGRYSPETNGEYFPIQMQNFISLSGDSRDNVILDAGKQNGVMIFENANDITVENLTITGGSHELAWLDFGFGVSCWQSNPSLTNIIITNNESSGFDCNSSNPVLTNVEITGNEGYGISCSHSTPVLTNVKIVNNAGGGIYCGSASDLKTKNVLIAENSAENGAGIYLYMCSPDLSDVIIRNNRADSLGGGIYCYGSSPTLTNIILDGNSAGEKGGGIYSVYLNYLKLINLTITGNTAASGSAIFGEQYSNVTLVNSILWDDPQQEIVVGSSVLIAYSNIQGRQASIVNNNDGSIYWLEGNIDTDPLFADLKSLHLSKNSPCIDAGIQDTLLIYNNGQNLFVPPMQYFGNAPDIGAVEFDPATSIESISETIPEMVGLFQNYPNPFNSSTTIEFALPKPAFVRLKVYNLLGEEVATLIAEKRAAGIHKLNWDARRLASGVYLYRLEAGEFVNTKKFILLR